MRDELRRDRTGGTKGGAIKYVLIFSNCPLRIIRIALPARYARRDTLKKREGLKVPVKQSKTGRLWPNDGLCIRLRPEYRNHGWSCAFVHYRTDDGKAVRTLNILDEHNRECLSIRGEPKLNSTEVIDALTDLFIAHLSLSPSW